MPSVFRTIEYRIEKWKFEEILGLKKIQWFMIFCLVILTLPSFLLGKTVASIYFESKYDFGEIVKESVVNPPEYTISETYTLLFTNSERDLYVKVSNKSQDAGYYPWVYDYKIYDRAGNILDQDTASSYLLPDDETYLVIPSGQSTALRVEITTNKEKSKIVSYDPNSDRFFDEPEIEIRNQSYTESYDDPDHVDIEFTLRNNDHVKINKVDVFYILRSVDGNIVGIGKYSFEDFDYEEEQEIKLKYPKPEIGTKKLLEIIPQVNYLDEENIEIR